MKKPFHFAESLLNWYKNNARTLPFRNEVSPYAIWISEVILQQTRVNQGLEYYRRFMARFPNIKSLAESTEEEVLKIWQGLGYYSRARNLHEAAQQIMSLYHGQMPSSYQELKKIKGIGPYTAAAISSIAFQEVIPAIDGNAKRVFSRFLGINTPVNTSSGSVLIEKAAFSFIDPFQPGNFNQAVMELGAMICTPKRPSCTNCPLLSECIAYKENQIEYIPLKVKKHVVKERSIFYFVFYSKAEDTVQLIMHQRTRNDIWKGLYDFPSLEFNEAMNVQKVIESEILKQQFPYVKFAELQSINGPLKHILTHRILWLHFSVYELSVMPHIENKNHTIYTLHEVLGLPLPRPIEIFLKEFMGKTILV